MGPPCAGRFDIDVDGKLYSGSYMKPKDLDYLPALPDIVRAGVAAVKIEGRFKSPRYVRATTTALRYALDAIRDGRDPTLPPKIRRRLERTRFFGSSAGYMGSRRPETDAIALDIKVGRFNRAWDLFTTPRTLALVPKMLGRKVASAFSTPPPPLTVRAEMDPDVQQRLAGPLPRKSPEIIVDTRFDYSAFPKGADRICIGEKFCAISFLARCSAVPELAARARDVGAKPYLTLPARVPERLANQLLAKVEELRMHVDGALCLDIGVASRVSQIMPVTLSALVQSRTAIRSLRDLTGAEAVRPYHLPLPLYLQHGFPDVPLHIPVFGRHVVDGMMFCISRLWGPCPEREIKTYKTRFEDAHDLLLSGTHLYSAKTFSAHPLRPQFLRLPVTGLVVDSFGHDAVTLERVIDYWKGNGEWMLPEDELCNGMLLENSPTGGFGCGGSRGSWHEWNPGLDKMLFESGSFAIDVARQPGGS